MPRNQSITSRARLPKDITEARGLKPLQPSQFVPNGAQRRFLEFHTRHVEIAWIWYFLNTQLRAIAVTGHTATIWRDDLDELVRLRLMVRGHGCADYNITNAGREACK